MNNKAIWLHLRKLLIIAIGVIIGFFIRSSAFKDRAPFSFPNYSLEEFPFLLTGIELEKLKKQVAESNDSTSADTIAKYYLYFEHDYKMAHKWFTMADKLGRITAIDEYNAYLRTHPEE